MPDANEIGSILTVGEVARLLNVHENTVRRWSNLGKIKVFRIGPRSDRRFRRDDIDRFLDGCIAYNFDVKEVSMFRT